MGYKLNKIYVGQNQVRPSAITSGGIYHNSDLGLISLSSDGSNWITIADKNLGATQAYNSGDTLSEANCGKYYQRGNNYGFPFSGPTTTTTTQVDASNYGPGNYYSSSNYCVNSYYYWDTSGNTDLRGYATGTNEAMQGPCPSGFHVPTDTEFSSMLNCITTLGISANNIFPYIKAPKCGYLAWNGGVAWRNSYQIFWTCKPYSIQNATYYWTTGGVYSAVNDSKGQGCNIRPFKNIEVVPTSTWTKLY